MITYKIQFSVSTPKGTVHNCKSEIPFTDPQTSGDVIDALIDHLQRKHQSSILVGVTSIEDDAQ
jgi:hypothetical protein